MDANGLSDPYVKFRMGHQKYKSKVGSAWALFKSLVYLGRFLSCKVNSDQVCFFSSMQTIPKTLNPQWREQFDFHLYDEQGGFIDITIWDKDAGKKDDFMGRLVMHLTFFVLFSHSHSLIWLTFTFSHLADTLIQSDLHMRTIETILNNERAIICTVNAVTSLG